MQSPVNRSSSSSLPMPYEYDIFISYKRDTSEETRRWIDDHFLPLTRHWVGLEIPYEPRIFIDKTIETGDDWPSRLAQAISSSKVLVPLFTKNYFYSKWCTMELAHMLKREKEAGFRTPQRSYGLIIPAIIHDCDDLKNEVGRMAPCNLRPYYLSRLVHNCEKAMELEQKICTIARSICRSIEAAPVWDPDWRNTAADEIQTIFYREAVQSQDTIPRY